MSVDQIAAEALRLSAEERAILASSLWESLEAPFRAPGCMDDVEAQNLAIERDRQIESGEVQPISHADLMTRLRR